MEDIKKVEELYPPIENLTKLVEQYPSKDTTFTFDKSLLENFKKGLEEYVDNSKNRTDQAIKEENIRNISTILIYTAVLIIIILVFLSFFMRWQLFLLCISIVLLFFIPGYICFAGYNAKFYFYYSDLCSSVHKAMYQGEFPVANQGLGYYMNCLDRKTKSTVYGVNYQLNQVIRVLQEDKGEEAKALLEKITNASESSIKPVLECDNVYGVVEKLEGDFCYKGMDWFKTIITLYTWLILCVLVFSLGVDRLEILVWKKRTEIESMIENMEALY